MRKFLAAFLAATLILSSVTFTVGANTTQEPFNLKLIFAEDFNDISDEDRAKTGIWPKGYGGSSSYAGVGGDALITGDPYAYTNNKKFYTLQGIIGTDAEKAVQWNEGVFEFETILTPELLKRFRRAAHPVFISATL